MSNAKLHLCLLMVTELLTAGCFEFRNEYKLYSQIFWRPEECEYAVPPAMKPCVRIEHDIKSNLCMFQYVSGSVCDGKADVDETGDWIWASRVPCEHDRDCVNAVPKEMEQCVDVQCENLELIPALGLCVVKYRDRTRCDGKDPKTDRTEDDGCLWDSDCERFGPDSICGGPFCLSY